VGNLHLILRYPCTKNLIYDGAVVTSTNLQLCLLLYQLDFPALYHKANTPTPFPLKLRTLLPLSLKLSVTKTSIQSSSIIDLQALKEEIKKPP